MNPLDELVYISSRSDYGLLHAHATRKLTEENEDISYHGVRICTKYIGEVTHACDIHEIPHFQIMVHG